MGPVALTVLLIIADASDEADIRQKLAKARKARLDVLVVQTFAQAMLSPIGCVTLPPATLDKLYRGDVLDESEQEIVNRMPEVTEKCLSHIPRIDAVREILHQHNRNFAAAKPRSDAAIDEEIPWGARALKIALDFDSRDAGDTHSDHPFAIMRGRKGWYDPVILEAFAGMRGSAQGKIQMLELSAREVAVGMVFGEDLKSSEGLLLIAARTLHRLCLSACAISLPSSRFASPSA
jgi:HD domain